MLQAPADEPEESCGKVKASGGSGERVPGVPAAPLPPAEPAPGPWHPRDQMEILQTVAIGAAVGAGVALGGVPAVIGALGFTGSGIAAGSVAANMMSAAAIANGGGVAAGSTVAVLQSIGAAGFSLGAQIGLTSALGSLGAGIAALLPTGE